MTNLTTTQLYRVTYNGNATRFKGFSDELYASSERQAVEKIYANYLDNDYFPQDDGTIKDCDGNVIAEPNDTVIEYDGGCFMAEVVEEN